MAKKIYFSRVNAETIATINTIAEVVFANAYTRNALAIEKKGLVKALEELGENDSKVEINNKINIVDMKRKALFTWTNNTLKPHKNSNDVWENGLFDELQINKELAEVYFDCKARNNYAKFRDNIKGIMSDVFGMDLNDKLINPFCTYLEHLVGSKLGTTKMILNGQLLKDETVLKFSEIMVMGIATYMSETCESICIPTVKHHKASVEFDKNIREVVGYKVELVETTEETTEEKKDHSDNQIYVDWCKENNYEVNNDSWVLFEKLVETMAQ